MLLPSPFFSLRQAHADKHFYSMKDGEKDMFDTAEEERREKEEAERKQREEERKVGFM